jgi:hypothetical protein
LNPPKKQTSFRGKIGDRYLTTKNGVPVPPISGNQSWLSADEYIDVQGMAPDPILKNGLGNVRDVPFCRLCGHFWEKGVYEGKSGEILGETGGFQGENGGFPANF